MSIKTSTFTCQNLRQNAGRWRGLPSLVSMWLSPGYSFGCAAILWNGCITCLIVQIEEGVIGWGGYSCYFKYFTITLGFRKEKFLTKSVKGLRLLAKTSPMMPTGKVWFKTKETKQLQCIISKRVTKENVWQKLCSIMHVFCKIGLLC